MVSKKTEKKIKEVIENYEYRHSGMRALNGGDAQVEIMDIEEHETYFDVSASTTLCQESQSTTYNDCNYKLHKKDLHLLTNEEVKTLR